MRRQRWAWWCLRAAVLVLVLSVLASIAGNVTDHPQAWNAIADLVGILACPLFAAAAILLLLGRVRRR